MSTNLRLPSYLLPFQSFYFEIIPESREIEDCLRKEFGFKLLKKQKKFRDKSYQIYIFPRKKAVFEGSDIYKISEIREGKFAISLYKLRGKKLFFYKIGEYGCLEFKKKRISLYIQNLDFFFYLLTISFLGHIQVSAPDVLVMHGGMFEYKDKRFVVFANNGGGKTTFLLNLAYSISPTKFLCDDIIFLFKKGRAIYARPAMNGNIDEIKNKTIKSFAYSLGYDNYLYHITDFYKIDKILFLKLRPHLKYTSIKFMKIKKALVESISSTFLAPLLLEEKKNRGIDILIALFREVPSFQIRLGSDLKYPGALYHNILNEII
jgi:hypothetical protein